jgi:hypothetical protein
VLLMQCIRSAMAVAVATALTLSFVKPASATPLVASPVSPAAGSSITTWPLSQLVEQLIMVSGQFSSPGSSARGSLWTVAQPGAQNMAWQLGLMPGPVRAFTPPHRRPTRPLFGSPGREAARRDPSQIDQAGQVIGMQFVVPDRLNRLL